MFEKLLLSALLLITIVLFLSEQLYAQEQETPSDSLVSISLKDGTTLKGRIVQEDEVSITVFTVGGLEVKAPESSVISIEPIRGRVSFLGKSLCPKRMDLLGIAEICQLGRLSPGGDSPLNLHNLL